MMTSCEPRNGQIQFRDRKKFASGQTVSRSAREADPIEGDPRGNLGRGKCHATWAPPFLATAAVTTSTRGLRCGDAVHASRRRHRRVASRAYHDHGRSRPRRSRGSTRRPRGEGLRRRASGASGASGATRLASPVPGVARRGALGLRRRPQRGVRVIVGERKPNSDGPLDTVQIEECLQVRALGPSWALPGGADPTSYLLPRIFPNPNEDRRVPSSRARRRRPATAPHLFFWRYDRNDILTFARPCLDPPSPRMRSARSR